MWTSTSAPSFLTRTHVQWASCETNGPSRRYRHRGDWAGQGTARRGTTRDDADAVAAGQRLVELRRAGRTRAPRISTCLPPPPLPRSAPRPRTLVSHRPPPRRARVARLSASLPSLNEACAALAAEVQERERRGPLLRRQIDALTKDLAVGAQHLRHAAAVGAGAGGSPGPAGWPADWGAPAERERMLRATGGAGEGGLLVARAARDLHGTEALRAALAAALRRCEAELAALTPRLAAARAARDAAEADRAAAAAGVAEAGAARRRAACAGRLWGKGGAEASGLGAATPGGGWGARSAAGRRAPHGAPHADDAGGAGGRRPTAHPCRPPSQLPPASGGVVRGCGAPAAGGAVGQGGWGAVGILAR